MALDEDEVNEELAGSTIVASSTCLEMSEIVTFWELKLLSFKHLELRVESINKRINDKLI